MYETFEIAHELGYKHPRNPHTQFPFIMTTDFLLTKVTESDYTEVVRAVKTREDFEKEQTKKKLEYDSKIS